MPTVEYGALLVGTDQGYFAGEGIDVELVQAGGGVATLALIAGDLQSTGSPSVAISAALRGARLKVLFVGEDHSAFQLWAQPEIKRFEDLKDQPVGIISRGDTTEIALRYILAKRNLPDDFHFLHAARHRHAAGGGSAVGKLSRRAHRRGRGEETWRWPARSAGSISSSIFTKKCT